MVSKSHILVVGIDYLSQTQCLATQTTIVPLFVFMREQNEQNLKQMVMKKGKMSMKKATTSFKWA